MYQKFYQEILSTTLGLRSSSSFAGSPSASINFFSGGTSPGGYVSSLPLRLAILSFILLSPFQALAQGTLKGTVKDQQQIPIVGATVQIKGTGLYSVTDENGHFEIEAVQ